MALDCPHCEQSFDAQHERYYHIRKAHREEMQRADEKLLGRKVSPAVSAGRQAEQKESVKITGKQIGWALVVAVLVVAYATYDPPSSRDGGSSESASSSSACLRLSSSAVPTTNSGAFVEAWAVKSARSWRGSDVYSVAIQTTASDAAILLLHNADGRPGSSGWNAGLWLADETSDSNRTGFPLNSSITDPMPTDANADVMGCLLD